MVKPHRCNVLCDGEIHVDTAWSEFNEPNTADRIATEMERIYGVSVVEVRRVEGLPPTERQRDTGMALYNPYEHWVECYVWGVWYRQPFDLARDAPAGKDPS